MNEKNENFRMTEHHTFEDICTLVRILRAPDGCPWDRAQTHASIRKNLLEEAYEVADAIDHDSPAMLREELGDFLFQAAFHLVLEEEKGNFTAADAVSDLCEKMIHRHPHVFGETGDVPDWQTLKEQEKAQTGTTETMRAIPRTLPALMYAAKLLSCARHAGFVYERLEDERNKVVEEWNEFHAAPPEVKQEEFGDLLLALVSYGKSCGIDAEEALTLASEKFLSRFAEMEAMLCADGGKLAQYTKKDLLSAWRNAKERVNYTKIEKTAENA